MPRFLLGVSGSVAGVKWPALAIALMNLGEESEVRVVFTAASQHFSADIARSYDSESFDLVQSHVTSGRVKLLTDADEWKDYRSVHRDSVLHIDLVKWADALVIAPLSANTLAKVANGLCDNLLTCIARAWDWRKPLLLAPAMNTRMWEHPLTARQLRDIASFPGAAAQPSAAAAAGSPSASCAAEASSTAAEASESSAATGGCSAAAAAEVGAAPKFTAGAIVSAVPLLCKPGVTIVEPIVKALACGDVGRGAMASVEAIAAAAAAAVGLSS